MSLLRVAVLMGGTSLEKECSFNSGRTVCDHLDTARYAVIPVFQREDGRLYILPWHFVHRGKISDFEYRLDTEAECISWDSLRDRVDFVYSALHGTSAEDGRLQGMLEVLGLPYVGTKIFGSTIAISKHRTRFFAQRAGLLVPPGITLPGKLCALLHHDHTYYNDLYTRILSAGITFPCIVKPDHEGSSFGVAYIQDEAALPHALYTASTVDPRCTQDVIVETCIEGMEFCCIVITQHDGTLVALEPTEIERSAERPLFDYEQKYMPGAAYKHTPARQPDAVRSFIQEQCCAFMRALHLQTVARIDGILTPDGSCYFLEANTFPGTAPSAFTFVQAAQAGMSHTDFINHLLSSELAHMDIDASHTPTQNGERVRVGVLLGGASHEREISLESGRNIVYKLSPNTYDAQALFVRQDMTLWRIPQSLLVQGRTDEIAEGLQPHMRLLWSDLKKDFDFIFIGLHGGLGENGAVQGALEMLGLPYNGSSVFASSLCMNKYETNAYLKAHGFDVPEHIYVDSTLWHIHAHDIPALRARNPLCTYPLIVKPHDDGCSVMVACVHSDTELHDALSRIFADGKQGALIEECITSMELTVGVIGNDEPHALPPTYTPKKSTVLSIHEKFLPGDGENITPAPLSPEAVTFVQETVVRAFKVLGCTGYARIDCFYQSAQESPTGSERVLFLECNTLPGMTPATCIFHQAAEIGLRPMEFVDLIVQYGLEAHASRIGHPTFKDVYTQHKQPTP